mgnify:CR=1 FL=1
MSSENRTSVPNSLNEHWMPFTSNKDFKANPRLITEAKGVYLKTHHGKTQRFGSLLGTSASSAGIAMARVTNHTIRRNINIYSTWQQYFYLKKSPSLILQMARFSIMPIM